MYEGQVAPLEIWTSLTAVFVVQGIVWVIATILKDYSIADITEGFVIAIPQVVILA